MPQYKGATERDEVKVSRRRKDTRLFRHKWADFFDSDDGAVLFCILLPIMVLAMIKVPLGGELVILIAWWFYRRSIKIEGRHFNFPYRVPLIAEAGDSSVPKGKMGEGITLLGNETDGKNQIYIGNSDLRTHQLVLGTTGSGKTEYLLGIFFNALVQNTGCIYVDGKGDPKLQKEFFRLSRYLGREDDLLIINFITSGRDFINKQADKVTNNMNMMGNTSSGMLIELIVALMDDSGGGGDMWKGRAISFVAALARPLCYLRDTGHINLSPDKFLDYFELAELEELVFNHGGKYGAMFDVVVAPLRSYLTTLPGYQKTKLKKQETKTLEQHGFIVMQLTRIFNDLNFNYGHIFKTQVGDVDFYDVVINRRILSVLLPALERAPDSMKMLGKMIVGSVKQMMAGCLGNRVEGVIREIIDSRPTNAKFPYYCIFDEYGYYAVVGFAVAPAQARSLGFSITFAAQDFSSLKKSSAEEADATWENTNMRVVGRLTSGTDAETWRRINGAAGESSVSSMSGFQREVGTLNEAFYQQDNIGIETKGRLSFDDVAQQADGEFHFIIGKKAEAGLSGGVRVIRGMGFYTASKAPKDMRINDFVPIIPPEPNELPKNLKALNSFLDALASGSFVNDLDAYIQADPIITGFQRLFNANDTLSAGKRLHRFQIGLTALGWFCQQGEGASLGALEKIDGLTEDQAPAALIAPSAESIQTAMGRDKEVPDDIMSLLSDESTSDSSDAATDVMDADSTTNDAKEAKEAGKDQLSPHSEQNEAEINQASASDDSVDAAVTNAIMAAATLVNTQNATVADHETKQFAVTDDDVDYDADIADEIIIEAIGNQAVNHNEKSVTAFGQLGRSRSATADDVLSALTAVIVADGAATSTPSDDLLTLPDASMYDIELLANPGINHMHQKFKAEADIKQIADSLNESTRYIDKPYPSNEPIENSKSYLDDIIKSIDAVWPASKDE